MVKGKNGTIETQFLFEFLTTAPILGARPEATPPHENVRLLSDLGFPPLESDIIRCFVNAPLLFAPKS